MSEKTIYDALRSGGLSPAGACAMMGNMYCESLLKSNIVETRSPLGGADYTYNVDHDIMPKQQFVNDSYGYGLCQWTWHTRKENLYDYAKSLNISIGDEQMQCGFCIQELQQYYVGLYRDLCSTDNLPEATKRICAEYEQPQINNFADRINAAQRYFNQLATGDTSCAEDACPIEYPEETCTINVRILRKGSLGRDVFLLQAGLFDMGYDCGLPDGDYGRNTEEAVKQLQKANNIDTTGTADWFVWQTVLNAR